MIRFSSSNGVVEKFESPHEAALRECQEEIGFAPQMKRLLVVDYKKGDEEVGDAVHYLFEAQFDSKNKIKVDGSEIEGFDWEPLESAASKFGSHLSKRYIAGLEAIKRNAAVFCHDGEILY